jgi:hypothetical protein
MKYYITRHYRAHGGVTSPAIDDRAEVRESEAAAFALAGEKNTDQVVCCVHEGNCVTGRRNTFLTSDGWYE